MACCCKLGIVPLNPLSLGRTVADYNGDLGVTTVAGNVSAWADQSGSVDPQHILTQGVAAQRPGYILHDAAFNNHGSLTFTIANSTLLGPNGAGWAAPLVGSAWAVLVGQADYSTAAQFYFDGFNSLESWSAFVEPIGASAGEMFFLSTGITESVGILPLTIVAQPTVYVMQFAVIGGNAYSWGWINARGALGCASVNPASPTLSGLTVGSFAQAAGTGDFLNGKIARIIIGNGVLTAGQGAGIGAYTCMQYGIPIL